MSALPPSDRVTDPRTGPSRTASVPGLAARALAAEAVDGRACPRGRARGCVRGDVARFARCRAGADDRRDSDAALRLDRRQSRRPAGPGHAAQVGPARGDPGDGGGADPLPGRGRPRRRRPRRAPGAAGRPRAGLFRARQCGAAPPVAREGRVASRRCRPMPTRPVGWPTRWRAAYGPASPTRSSPPSATSRRSTSASRPTPVIGRAISAGALLPTGTVRLGRPWRRPVAAGLRGRRLVGAGRRRRAAGPPSRRCRRPARRRSLRGAGRQDGAARRQAAPGSPPSTAPRSGSSGCATTSSGSNWAPRSSRPTSCPSRRRPSTPCCSTRRAAPPARSAAIPMSPGRRPREDLGALVDLQRRMLARAARLVKAGRPPRLLHLLAGAGGRRAPDRGVPRARRTDFARVPSWPHGDRRARRGRAARRATCAPCPMLADDDPAMAGLDGFFAARLRRSA